MPDLLNATYPMAQLPYSQKSPKCNKNLLSFIFFKRQLGNTKIRNIINVNHKNDKNILERKKEALKLLLKGFYE